MYWRDMSSYHAFSRSLSDYEEYIAVVISDTVYSNWYSCFPNNKVYLFVSYRRQPLFIFHSLLCYCGSNCNHPTMSFSWFVYVATVSSQACLFFHISTLSSQRHPCRRNISSTSRTRFSRISCRLCYRHELGISARSAIGFARHWSFCLCADRLPAHWLFFCQLDGPLSILPATSMETIQCGWVINSLRGFAFG